MLLRQSDLPVCRDSWGCSVMVRGPEKLRLKSLSYRKQVTTVTGIGACEPTSENKITERVVLWFHVWLSQITQEVAETTQTESQNLQGRPDPFVCLIKHRWVIPRAQGGIHPLEYRDGRVAFARMRW